MINCYNSVVVFFLSTHAELREEETDSRLEDETQLKKGAPSLLKNFSELTQNKTNMSPEQSQGRGMSAPLYIKREKPV